MTIHLKDKKITILQLVSDGEDDLGQPVSKWEPLPGGDGIWAYYRQSSGNEYWSSAGAGEQARVDAVFEINWRDDLDTYMKVLFRGRKYNIIRIDDFEGYKQGLTLSTQTANQ